MRYFLWQSASVRAPHRLTAVAISCGQRLEKQMNELLNCSGSCPALSHCLRHPTLHSLDPFILGSVSFFFLFVFVFAFGLCVINGFALRNRYFFISVFIVSLVLFRDMIACVRLVDRNFALQTHFRC